MGWASALSEYANFNGKDRSPLHQSTPAVEAIRTNSGITQILSLSFDGVAWIVRTGTVGEGSSKRDVTSGLATAFIPDHRAIVGAKACAISAWERRAVSVCRKRFAQTEAQHPL